jgi:hypothetical protein
MASPYLVSTVLMGVLLLAVALFVTGDGRWRRNARATGSLTARSSSAGAESPLPSALFAVPAVGVAAGALAFAGGLAAGLSVQASAGYAVAAVAAAIIVSYLVWGVYGAMRSRGFGSAAATMMSAWAVGALLIAAIAVKLLLES